MNHMATILKKTESKIYLELVLPYLPSDVDLKAIAASAQDAVGLYTSGYDGPFGLSVEVNPKGGYTVYWSCMGSCE